MKYIRYLSTLIIILLNITFSPISWGDIDTITEYSLDNKKTLTASFSFEKYPYYYIPIIKGDIKPSKQTTDQYKTNFNDISIIVHYNFFLDESFRPNTIHYDTFRENWILRLGVNYKHREPLNHSHRYDLNALNPYISLAYENAIIKLRAEITPNIDDKNIEERDNYLLLNFFPLFSWGGVEPHIAIGYRKYQYDTAYRYSEYYIGINLLIFQ